MKRKIVKHGNATLTVSLPSRWVKKYHLKKGDEIELTEKENNLILGSEKEEFSKKIEINIDNLYPPYLLGWVLGSLYKKGFDEIVLRYERPKPKLIYDILEQTMVGFAVTEQTDRMCVLKAIAKEEAAEFDPVLRRVFSTVNSFAKGCLDYTKKGEFSRLKELFFLEKTVDKLVNFCERILIKRGYTEFEKTCFMYIVAWNLEKISEYYYSLSKHLIAKKKIKLRPKILDLFARVNELFELFYDTFYNYEIDKVVLLYKRQKEIDSDAEKLIDELTTDEIIVVNYLKEIALRINHAGTLTALNYKVDDEKS